MPPQNSELEIQAGTLGRDARAEVFGAYGLALAETKKSWKTSDERLLSGSMDFVGRGARVFSSPHGEVLAWVEVEADDGFMLGSLHPGRSNLEGEVILF